MAPCEPDNFRSTSENQLVLSCLTECPMIPTPPKAGFAFQISGVPNHYPTTALTIIDQDHNFSLFSFVKEPESVSCRLIASPGRDPSSAPNSILSMSPSTSGVGKNTHLQQPAQVPTFGATQISYGSLKKLTATGASTESHSPSLRSPRYYSLALPEVSASNREGLGGFQSPGYEHLTYSSPDHSFHSTSPSSSSSRGFHSGIHLESNPPLSHHYQQGQRHGGSELYAQQTAVKLQLEPMPVKIECPHVMSSSTWVYPTTHQMNPAPHQINYQDTASGITTAHDQSQLPPQSPGIATSVVHLALNGQNGIPTGNASSRSHSPGNYSFQGPTANAIHSSHNSMYTGGVAAPSTSTFPDTNSGPARASEPHPLLHESDFSGPSGPLGPPSIHLDYTGVYNADRAQDVQLLHCSQCPQRFATHDQFAKHQNRHQKLHRCRISGCSRGDGFTTPNDRDRHEKSVHKTPGTYFRCMDESCASYMKTFARRDNLKDHLKRMHKMPQDMDDMEANERRNELADSWRVDLTPGLTPTTQHVT